MLIQVIVPGARPLLFLLLLAGACGDSEKEGEESGAEAAGGGAVAEAKENSEPGESDAGPAQPDVTYAETREGLQRLMTDLLASVGSGGDAEQYERLMHSIRLPDYKTWFQGHFRRRVARRLIGEYEPIHQEIGQMKKLLTSKVQDGLLGVDVERFRSPDDSRATGYQSKALAAMMKRVPLYSVRLYDDPRKNSFHLWSFVHVEGTFRFLGKMRAVVRKEPPKERGRDLFEFRVADAKRIELAQKLEELDEESD